MKTKMIAMAALACAAALAAGTAGPTRPGLAAMEKGLDGQFAALWPDEPFLLLGATRGLCLDGYGAVFTTELNLVAAPLRTPMSPPVPDAESIERMHQKKLERLAKLRTAMHAILAQTASSLDNIPPDQQIVLAVTLTRFSWENTTKIPTHIVMRGRRGDLLQAKNAGAAALDQVVKVQEY